MPKTTQQKATNLTETVNGLPVFQNDEVKRSQLQKEAQAALQQYISSLPEHTSPLFGLHVLLRVPDPEDNLMMVYSENEADMISYFMQDIRKLLMDPRFSKALIKRGNNVEDIATTIDKLCAFFERLREFETMAHMRLFDIQRPVSELPEEELKHIKDTYNKRAAIQEASNQIWGRKY